MTITRDDVLTLRSIAPSLAELCDRAVAGQRDAWHLVRTMLERDARHVVYVHHWTGDQLRVVGDRADLVGALRLAREYLGDARAIQVAVDDGTVLRVWVKRYPGVGEIVEEIARREYAAANPAPETRNQAKARRARARRAARRA